MLSLLAALAFTLAAAGKRRGGNPAFRLGNGTINPIYATFPHKALQTTSPIRIQCAIESKWNKLAMENLSEELFKGVLRLIGYTCRLLFWLIIYGGCYRLPWYLGWPLCRLLSLGCLPAQGIHDYRHASFATRLLVASAGLLGLYGLIALVITQTGSY